MQGSLEQDADIQIQRKTAYSGVAQLRKRLQHKKSTTLARLFLYSGLSLPDKLSIKSCSIINTSAFASAPPMHRIPSQKI